MERILGASSVYFVVEKIPHFGPWRLEDLLTARFLGMRCVPGSQHNSATRGCVNNGKSSVFGFRCNGTSFDPLIPNKFYYPIMNILLMVAVLIMGYLVFMGCFYLLARWLFPKIDITEEEKYSNALEVFEAKKLKEIRQARRNKIYRFKRQAA